MPAVAPLTTRGLNRATLARQGLLEPMVAEPADAVRRLGSLQAQHPEWPPVALATRSAVASTADLRGALERREVVRSSLMRITIHVVAADDLWPMFAVCQPLRLAQWSLMTKVDPVDSDLGERLSAAHRVAIAALRERPRSSLELDRLMSHEAGLDPDALTRPAWREPATRIPVRVAWRHFAASVPLVHVPHQAEGYGRSRYALAADWIGRDDPEVPIEESRAQLARRFLASFGPATLDDLAAYVGRGRGGLSVWRDALAALDDQLLVLRDDQGRTLFDLRDAPRPDAGVAAPPRLLARWDSLLLSHAASARQRIIADEDRPAVFSKNADVLPTFTIDGFVAGTWQLSRSDGEASIALQPFRALPRDGAEALVAEAQRVLALLEPGRVRSVSLTSVAD